jgi:hypothetical protein
VGVTNLVGSDAREIRLIPDDSGGVIATWIDLSQDGGVGDLYTQRVDATGTLLWGASGVAVASVSNTIEHTARVVPDGSGGAYYAWEDNRLGYGSIHAEHVNAHGAGRWLPGFGVLVSSNESYRPQLARDPISGGVFYGYIRPGILGGPSHIAYARLSSTGTTVWGEQSFGLSYGDTVAVAADGIGGVVFAYHDAYYGVFVSRVANDLTETSSDVKLGALPADAVFAVGDGRGGAVVAWRGVSADGYFSNTDYAQRLTLNGTLGQVLPNITKVVDVTNDEGGFVRVQVGAAGADVRAMACGAESSRRASRHRPRSRRPTWRIASRSPRACARERCACNPRLQLSSVCRRAPGSPSGSIRPPGCRPTRSSPQRGRTRPLPAGIARCSWSRPIPRPTGSSA